MDTSGDHDPLLDRVDLLLKRHKQPLRSPDDDVPVLTEVVQPENAAPVPDAATLQALVTRLSETVIRGVEADLTQHLIARLEPRIAALIAAEISTMREDLLSDLRASVPAAIAAALSDEPEASGHLASR